MFRIVAPISALVMLLLLSAGKSGQPAKAEQKHPTTTAQAIRSRLAMPVSLDKVENMSFKDAIEFLGERYHILILVNNSAFKEELAVESVDEQIIRLPRTAGVKLGSVLRMLVSQIKGAYLIRGDHIEITTPQRTSPLAWQKERRLAPTVDADFQNRPLNTALRELSDESGISIVLDARSAELAKAPVTATLNGVPVDTAVELLASMVGLRMVVRDRVLYVTGVETSA
jgi:hypothetical protein